MTIAAARREHVAGDEADPVVPGLIKEGCRLYGFWQFEPQHEVASWSAHFRAIGK
jgi:hypothetical protein